MCACTHLFTHTYTHQCHKMKLGLGVENQEDKQIGPTLSPGLRPTTYRPFQNALSPLHTWLRFLSLCLAQRFNTNIL